MTADENPSVKRSQLDEHLKTCMKVMYTATQEHHQEQQLPTGRVREIIRNLGETLREQRVSILSGYSSRQLK